jgi:CRISPR-associated protein Csc2
MTFIKTVDLRHFQTLIAYKPMGSYIHSLTLPVTEFYPLF